jgi:hypothetical protein
MLLLGILYDKGELKLTQRILELKVLLEVTMNVPATSGGIPSTPNKLAGHITSLSSWEVYSIFRQFFLERS